MKREGRDRFKILFLLIALAFLLVEARLVKLQFVEHDFWSLESQKNRTRGRSIPFKRGWILDRNMRPLALTETLFELRFVFRNYRLTSPAGHLSMVAYLLSGERPDVAEIYEDPGPWLDHLSQLTPAHVTALENRWKQRDLKTYLKWLLDLSREEEDALFGSRELETVTLGEFLEDRVHAAGRKILEERETLLELEALAGVSVLPWPDKAARRADRVVEALLDREGGLDSYHRQRRHHREVDSYENTVTRNIPHEAALRIVLAGERYPGFYVVESTQRSYPPSTRDVCPLLIGKTGLPFEEEVATLNEHRKRLEELSLIEEKTEDEMFEEENLRILIRDIDVFPDEEVGRLGLEEFLEPVLRGKRGFLLEERGPGSKSARTIDEIAPVTGKDVVLTLDVDLQCACEKALAATNHPAAAVIMNVHSGAILAMATAPLPTRDDYVRRWSQLSENPERPLMQRSMTNYYLPPPGSVFKIVTSVAGLEEGAVSTEDFFECPGRIHVGRSSLRCEGIHGPIAMSEAVVKSCNVYFYRLAGRLGYEALFSWAERFGFGRRTGFLDRSLYGIEEEEGYRPFPSEAAGRLKYREQGEANLMRFGIGQGAIDDVTPMQVARMMAGVATGRLPQPHLISKIGSDAVPIPRPEDLGIAPDVLAFLHQAMEAVVTRGTAEPDPAVALDLTPFKVAGKTGTPQVGGGRPSHACFAGYFPHDDPEWSFAVFVESCGKHGGEMAAPVLNRILESEAAKPYVEGDGR
jgi:cell division protein FtsI/penicillin-binding protein 2